MHGCKAWKSPSGDYLHGRWRIIFMKKNVSLHGKKYFFSRKETFFFMERIRSRQVNSQMGEREGEDSSIHIASSRGIDFRTPLPYTHNI
ncbi:hypothetical protein [Prevotella denticola]|uniref:hypothetical protein n=1 Tax=Prevotella denticola TaxID=28129 RepID=UPI0028ED54EC|nr:hypothetical protein [Prevotella denticola]